MGNSSSSEEQTTNNTDNSQHIDNSTTVETTQTNSNNTSINLRDYKNNSTNTYNYTSNYFFGGGAKSGLRMNGEGLKLAQEWTGIAIQACKDVQTTQEKKSIYKGCLREFHKDAVMKLLSVDEMDQMFAILNKQEKWGLDDTLLDQVRGELELEKEQASQELQQLKQQMKENEALLQQLKEEIRILKDQVRGVKEEVLTVLGECIAFYQELYTKVSSNPQEAVNIDCTIPTRKVQEVFDKTDGYKTLPSKDIVRLINNLFQHATACKDNAAQSDDNMKNAYNTNLQQWGEKINQANTELSEWNKQIQK